MALRHTWDKGVIVKYHPQVEPSWVTKAGYRKPEIMHTCQVCGEVICGDSGSGCLLYLLNKEDCTGVMPQTTVLNGPLRQATGPEDYEGLGRERYWDMTDEQRREALPKVVADSNLGALRAPDKEFARGWLSELGRHQRALGDLTTKIR